VSERQETDEGARVKEPAEIATHESLPGEAGAGEVCSGEAAPPVPKGHPVRVGVIVPSPNTVLEPDAVGLVPIGVTAHFGRVGLGTVLSEDLLEAMAGEVSLECRKLALAGVSAIGYGCTSGSFFKSEGFDRRMVEAMTRASGGIPATTATTAALAVLRERGVSRVAFLSPYEESFHRRGVAYFEREGFTVVSDACLGFLDEADIMAVTRDDLVDLVRRGGSDEAEAYFISCTGLRSVTHLAYLEGITGRPVLSSNLTLVAHVVRLAGV